MTTMDLHRQIAAIIRATGKIDAGEIDEFAELIIDVLRQNNGFNFSVIPPNKPARNAAIRHEFNGRNMHAVCLKYGVSKTTIYRIVEERR
jgi:Mor family transcriptional regulator